jgi:hypothetical protein
MALHGQLSDLTARRSRYATARPATIRRHLINLAGRIARHASSVTIHLPQHWPLAAAVAAIVRGSACPASRTWLKILRLKVGFL